jgi:hypothetical protein
MECGHAAPQAPAVTGNAPPALIEGTEQPAAPAVSERCWRRIPPGFTEQCPNDATGGVRLKLYPALSIQKRYGKRDMLALIFDLPVCADLLLADDRDRGDQQPAAGHVAARLHQGSRDQQRNHGILPIKEESVIEHIAFSDPEYELLRQTMLKRSARRPTKRRKADGRDRHGDPRGGSAGFGRPRARCIPRST